MVATESEAFQKGIEGERVGAFACIDGASLGLVGVTTSEIRAFSFLQQVLDDIIVVVTNPAKNA